MIVDPDRLREELDRACADAGLRESSLVVWIVCGTRPARATPIAYLHPDGRVRDDTVLVFRAVGEERAGAFFGLRHRLALWRELPGLPDAALGPMLRHELEHARRWERSGTAFYEADERLRKRFALSYAALPTEREANAAAAAYAERVLATEALAELRSCSELADLFGAEPAVGVVESTFALLGERVEIDRRELPSRSGGPTIELVPG